MCVVGSEFLAFNVYFSILFFRNKSDVYLILYILNIEKTRLKSICICVGRQRILNGYCVTEKFKISDIQNIFNVCETKYILTS